MFEPVKKQSLSEAVYTQLRSRILSGEIAAGAELPSERVLCDSLGVNRGAVREGIKRLQQAGLVQVRHGGPTLVLDFLQEAGLELLPGMIVDEQGTMRTAVARSIVSMRESLAPGVAREAARSGGGATADRLDAIVVRMQVEADLASLQEAAFEFWQELVNGSGNVAYRLAFNSMRKTYKAIWSLLTQAMAEEFRDVDTLAALAAAVRKGDAAQAEQLARRHVAIGTAALNAVLDNYAQLRREEP